MKLPDIVISCSFMFCTHCNLFTAATVAYIVHTVLTSLKKKTTNLCHKTVCVNKSSALFWVHTRLCCYYQAHGQPNIQHGGAAKRKHKAITCWSHAHNVSTWKASMRTHTPSHPSVRFVYATYRLAVSSLPTSGPLSERLKLDWLELVWTVAMDV